MTITYDDIKHKSQPPLDCSEIKDLRGRYFHNRLITNYENTDFIGCVLFHCFPSGIENALEVNPALSEEDVTLKGVDLEGANLRRANLSGADLTGANLTGANLSWANLCQANLERANLYQANLGRATLQGANFKGANLEESALKSAYYNDTTKILETNITAEQLEAMAFE